VAVAAAVTVIVPDLFAQTVATAVIRGSVQSSGGEPLDDAEITILDTATGFRIGGRSRAGRFEIRGLEVGGPYVVVVELFGFQRQQRAGLFLGLGEPAELRFVLQPHAIAADTLRVAIETSAATLGDGGTGTTISDSLLHRLPSLDRDFYDFVRLVPQISTKIGFQSGFSGGGVGFRYNNILINGVPERSLAAHATPALVGGKSLPLDAVKEYEVLLAPYDVRYGDFAGAMVNTVTRSGTNELRGSGFAFARSDGLARDLGTGSPYERIQYGLSAAGPIRRDRLHFFAAVELQRLDSPAPGPFLGQPESAAPAVPVREADIDRLGEILAGYGLEGGSGGAVENGNPLTNVFARLDLGIPEWNSRAALWTNYAGTGEFTFSRLARDTFSLSTYQLERANHSHLMSLQLHTSVPAFGNAHNALLVSHQSEGGDFRSAVDQPIVRVAVPSTTDGFVTVNTGTHEAAHGVSGRAWRFNVRDDFTLSVGTAHVLTFGGTAERFRDDRRGVMGAYGTWTFPSMEALEQGLADRYEIRRDFGSAGVPITGWYLGAHVGDQWRVDERLTLTFGLRGDAMSIDERAPYNARVDSIFQRRTDEMPGMRLHLSPRMGFTWDLSGTGRDLIRGGIGVFTGRPPLHWLRSALSNHGTGIGVLRCGRLSSDRGTPPPFVPDFRAAPTACANGAGLSAAPNGDVDLLAGDLRMARSLRASLAYDRELPGELVGTVEALLTWATADFAFVNLNLAGPQGQDRNGRVLYGTIESTALSSPVLRSSFSEVIDLRNVSRNHAAQISARIEKRFSDGMSALASYTFSRVRDAQTPLRTGTPGIVNWASRGVSGNHDDLSPGISLNDIPHRVILAGTWRAPWRRWTTAFSFYYVGESGSPFTYLAWGVGRRGDLNADGSNGNDPIYVPRDAFDPQEIAFSGLSESGDTDNSPAAQSERIRLQQEAFERFIGDSPCLREQRGRILEGNSCREPWSHTTVLSVRQEVPAWGHAFEAQLDVFNVLNLLDEDWGLYRVAEPALLEHVGQGAGAPGVAQSTFRFDTTRAEWTTLPTESAFQLQIALRYSF
jgi:hypothetical protein